jgi:hypothetical protein
MLDHVVNDIPMCTLSSATTTPPGGGAPERCAGVRGDPELAVHLAVLACDLTQGCRADRRPWSVGVEDGLGPQVVLVVLGGLLLGLLAGFLIAG